MVDADSALIIADNFNVNSPVHFDTIICNNNFYCNGAIINKLNCNQMAGDSNLIHEIEFLSDTFCSSFPSYCNYIYGDGNIFEKANIHSYYFDINGNNSFDSLIFSNIGQQITLHGDTILINDELSFTNSCSQWTSFISKEGTALVSLPSSTSPLDNFYLQNVSNGAGVGITLNSSIDGGGNTGWIFNQPPTRTLFWVGGSGNWSDPIHWSTSSGSVGGNCIPTKYDSLFFDGNSFLNIGDTLVFDLAFSYSRYFNAIAVLNSPTFIEKSSNFQLNVDGTIVFSPNMYWNDGPDVNLYSQIIGNSIQTSGVFLGSQVSIIGSGTWNILSNLDVKNLLLLGGTMNTNNFNVSGDISTNLNSNGVTVNFGTSFVSGNNFQLLSGANVVLNADSASFIFIDGFVSSKGVNFSRVKAGYIYSDSCTFKNATCYSFYGSNSIVDVMDSVSYLDGANSLCKKVEISSENLSVSGTSLLIDSLLFMKPGINVSLSSNTQLRVNMYFNLNGSCGDFASMVCYFGNAFFIYSGGNFVVDYIKLQNVIAVGPSTYTANNCIDLGSNSNWMINVIPPRSLFWVGGSGSWWDFNHWSLTSGGIGGACVPNYSDDVFFDVNSFLSTADTVYTGDEEIQINTLDARGVLNFPTLLFQSNILKVYGSFYLGANMNLIMNAVLGFVSNTRGNIIQTNGTPLSGTFQSTRVYFSGIGSWELASDLVTDMLYHEKGIFRTNNFAITALEYDPRWNINQDDSLFLGTSILNIDRVDFSRPDMYVDADSCTFISKNFLASGSSMNFNEVFSDYIYTSNCSFKFVQCETFAGGFNYVEKVNFINSATTGGSNYFDKIILTTNLNVYGYCNTDTLILNNPGQTILFYPNSQLNVSNYLQIQSSPNTPTTLRGANGKIGKVKLLIDTLCTDHLILQNVEAIGPGIFYAGSNSIDKGNNVGWIFSSCTIDSSTVWPGDANADLIADNVDYLAIGITNGFTGNVRPNASLLWLPQPCLDWNYQFVSGGNYNNSDCDGNGIVNSNDTLAIVANYGLTHPLRMPSSDQSSDIGVPLTFDMPSVSLVPGSNVNIPIELGTSLFPSNNIYGIAFTVNYDPAFVQAGSMQIDIANSWLGDGSNSIYIGKDNFANGQFDVGFVRMDHQNISGIGMIATLSFTVANASSGLLNLSFSKVVAIDKNEYSIPILAVSSSIFTPVIENVPIVQSVTVFPNPARNYLVVSSPFVNILQITCFDFIGNTMFSIKGNGEYLELSTQSLSEGIYVLKIETLMGVINKKLIIRN